MSRVMISYSTRRRTSADALHAALIGLGLKPRLDHLDLSAGDRRRESLARWLSTCQTAVVLLCPDAVASPWVRYELSVLANRELASRDVRLILVCLGGLKRAELAADPMFEPCRLAEIQMVHELDDLDLDAGQITELAELVHQHAMTADTPVARYVADIQNTIRTLGSGPINGAHRRLPRPGDADPDDTWDLGDDIPAGLDGENRLQWRFAQRYCATPATETVGALEVLVADRSFDLADALDLVDVSRRLTIDPRAPVTLDEQRRAEPTRSVVLAATRATTADLTLRAMQDLTDCHWPYVHFHDRFTGRGTEQVIDGIVEWFRDELEGDGEDPDTYLADMAADGNPVFIAFTRAEGLTIPVLEGVARRLPSISFLVLCSETRGPRRWAELLRRPIIGPDVEGDAWEELLAHEARIDQYRGEAERKLNQVRKATAR